jgi:hypothetical protein
VDINVIIFSTPMVSFYDGGYSMSLCMENWALTSLVLESLSDMEKFSDVEALESSVRGQRRRHNNVSCSTPGKDTTSSMTRSKRVSKRAKNTFQLIFWTKLKEEVDSLEKIVMQKRKRVVQEHIQK